MWAQQWFEVPMHCPQPAQVSVARSSVPTRAQAHILYHATALGRQYSHVTSRHLAPAAAGYAAAPAWHPASLTSQQPTTTHTTRRRRRAAPCVPNTSSHTLGLKIFVSPLQRTLAAGITHTFGTNISPSPLETRKGGSPLQTRENKMGRRRQYASDIRHLNASGFLPITMHLPSRT